MSNRKITKTVKTLLALLITVTAAVGALHVVSTDMTTQQQPATTESTHSVRQWTAWSESAYPDMYRIVGKADIAKQATPGKVEYNESADGHPYVIATLTKENLAYGKRERGDISDIYPPGWKDNERVEITEWHNVVCWRGLADVAERVEIRYADGTVYHGYFWNRSHLLAHMLGGEDSTENLITGTRPQNVGKNDGKGGMQYAENLAADYIKNGGESIVYNVTPVYKDGDVIPRSVFIDIRSDDGSINQEIEVYNAAPGFEINYKTGEWHAIS